jgi:dihydropteroate synthase
VITLTDLAALAAAHPQALAAPVAPLEIAGRVLDLDRAPLIMGVVNLSRDSTYRDSVAVSVDSAVRRARIMAAQGAGLIDLGAESTTAKAARVSAAEQSTALVPVISELTAEGVAISVEAYDAGVVRAALGAGAAVVNLTGTRQADEILELVAEHSAAVILCFMPGATAREVGDLPVDGDPFPELRDHFAARIEHARARGVRQIVIDPGLGFYYANLTEPAVRARAQAALLASTFRLRELGVPVCQSLPHAFDLFEEEFRSAEGFFAMLALLGRAGVLRVHEVGRVAAVARAMGALEVGPPAGGG